MGAGLGWGSRAPVFAGTRSPASRSRKRLQSMPVYIVTGKLGSGKTLSMVGRMRDYLAAGKPVATNVALDLRRLLRTRPKGSVVRLPDRPTVSDLEALGAVHGTGREELNGALVLDECGTFLNSRMWGDKGRQAFIDWLLHSRKLGWDVFLIVQHAQLLDKQIRDAMAEYTVTCRRLDRVKIPVIGSLCKVLTLGLWSGRLPLVHVALVTYGAGVGGIHADTWLYRGRELYGAYSTEQVISDVSPGVHSLVWYATEEEVAAWPPKPKPKLHVVRLASGLSRDEAWRWAKRWVEGGTGGAASERAAGGAGAPGGGAHDRAGGGGPAAGAAYTLS